MPIGHPQAMHRKAGPRGIKAYVGRGGVTHELAAAFGAIDADNASRGFYPSGQCRCRERLVVALRESFAIRPEICPDHVESHLCAFGKTPLMPRADLTDDVADFHRQAAIVEYQVAAIIDNDAVVQRLRLVHG